MSVTEDQLRALIEEGESRMAAKGAPAPAAAAGPPDIESLLSEAETRMAAKEDTVAEYAGAIPRALYRGAVGTHEFFGDVGDVLRYPLQAARVAASNIGAERQGFEKEDYPPNPFTQESPADRVRAKARESAGVTRFVKRQISEDQHPVIEGVLTGAEVVGGAAAGGGTRAVVKPILTSALGAGLGRTGAEAVDAGEGATVAAEVIGSLAGLMRPSSAPGVMKNIFERLRGMNDIRQKRQALEDIREALIRELPHEEGQRALATLEARVKQGDAGSLGTLADTPGARGLEAAVAARTQAKPQLAAAHEATRQQARERIATVSPEEGVSARAPALQESFVAQERAAVGAATEAATATEAGVLQRAQEAAETQRGRLAAVPDVETAGAAAADVLTTRRTAAKDAEKLAWAAVPKSETLKTTSLKRAYRQLLPPTEQGKRAFKRSHGAMMGDIEAALAKPDLAVGELIDLQHNISDTISTLSKQGVKSSYADAIASALSTRIKNMIDRAEGVGPAFKAARRATAARYDAFDEGILGKARRAARDAPATTGEKLTPAGTKGGETIRAARKAGVADEAAESLRAQFKKASTNADGTFNPGKASTFMSSREAALKELPEVAAELRDITTSGRAAVTAEKVTLPAAQKATQAREKARLAEIEAGAPSKFSGESGARAAGEALDSRTPAADARQLVANAKEAGGDAIADLQSSYMDAVLSKIVSEKGAGRKLTTEEITARLSSYEEALSEVLDPDQMARIKSAAEPLDRLAKNQKLTEEVIRDLGDSKGRKAKTILARVLGIQMASAVVSNPLLAAALASSAVKKVMVTKPQKAFEDLLKDYTLNPSRYVDDIARLNDAANQPGRVAAVLDEMFNKATGAKGIPIGAAAAGRGEEE